MGLLLRTTIGVVFIIVLLVFSSMVIGWLSKTTVMALSQDIDGHPYLVDIRDLAHGQRFHVTERHCIQASQTPEQHTRFYLKRVSEIADVLAQCRLSPS